MALCLRQRGAIDKLHAIAWVSDLPNATHFFAAPG